MNVDRLREALRTKDAETIWEACQEAQDMPENTSRAYRCGLLDLLSAWHDVDLLTVTTHDIEKYMEALRESRYAEASIGVKLAAARLLCKVLDDHGFTAGNSFAFAKRTRSGENESNREPYTTQEFVKLLDAVSPRNKVVILLATDLNLRIEDMRELRWSDVRREGERYFIADVRLSTRLAEALNAIPKKHHLVLAGVKRESIRESIKRTCDQIGLTYKGIDVLRQRYQPPKGTEVEGVEPAKGSWRVYGSAVDYEWRNGVTTGRGRRQSIDERFTTATRAAKRLAELGTQFDDVSGLSIRFDTSARY